MLNEIFFPVVQLPVTRNGEPTKKTKILREDTGEMISLLSNIYTLVPNVEVHKTIQSVFGEIEPKTYFSDGYYSRFSYVLEDRTKKVAVNDIVAMMINVENSYDGSKRLRVSIDLLRLVCSNGMRVGESVYEDTFLHKSVTPQSILSNIEISLLNNEEHFNTAVGRLKKMKKTKLTEEVKTDLVKGLATFPSFAINHIVNEMAKIQPENLYDMYNIITDYTSNVLEIKNTSRELMSRDLDRMIVSLVK